MNKPELPEMVYMVFMKPDWGSESKTYYDKKYTRMYHTLRGALLFWREWPKRERRMFVGKVEEWMELNPQ